MLRILWSHVTESTEESDSSNQCVMTIKAKEVPWSWLQEERGTGRTGIQYPLSDSHGLVVKSGNLKKQALKNLKCTFPAFLRRMCIQEECVGLLISLCCHLTHGTASLIRKCWSQQDKEKTEKLVSPCLWASSIMHTLCYSLTEWQMATWFMHEARGWSTKGEGIDFYRCLGHTFRCA